MRESWTDERLDDMRTEVRDLRAEVRDGFKGVDGEFARLRTEMKAGFDRVDDKFNSLQRMLIWFSGSLSVSLIGLLATLVVTQI